MTVRDLRRILEDAGDDYRVYTRRFDMIGNEWIWDELDEESIVIINEKHIRLKTGGEIAKDGKVLIT